MIKDGVVLVKPIKYDIVLETSTGGSRQEIIEADGFEQASGLMYFYRAHYAGDELPYEKRVFYILNERKLIDMKIDPEPISPATP